MDEIIPAAHWLALGHDDIYANSMEILQMTLIDATARLNLARETGGETETMILIGTAEGLEVPLDHDDLLLHLWMGFSEALAEHGAVGSISIAITIANITLPGHVMDLLEPSLKATPFHVDLRLHNNGLQNDGINFITRLLKENSHFIRIMINRNLIDVSAPETLSLLQAARDNPCLQSIQLNYGAVGPQLSMTPEIVPIILSVPVTVGLRGNSIGTNEARLITDCLATNPPIQILDLTDNNLFDVEDAELFSHSLKSNTNLSQLVLRGLSSASANILYRSVYNDENLNTIEDSNHTCELILSFDEESFPCGMGRGVLAINGKTFESHPISSELLGQSLRSCNNDADPLSRMNKINVEGRKKMKLLHALMGGDTFCLDMHYLNGFPLELIPNALATIQKCISCSGKEERNLDALFQFIGSNNEAISFHVNGVSGVIEEEGQCKRQRLC